MSEYTFFWKNRSPFSQWYPSKFTDFYGAQFSCAEQFMMCYKAMLFGDEKMATNIMMTKEPREQKDYGCQVQGFDYIIWELVCRKIVVTGNYFKFTQSEKCREALLATGDTLLVEASPYDRVWGIGYEEADALDHIGNWGSNYLGKCLVEVRTMIRNGTTPEFDPIKEYRE